jgi:hypothetical protein
LLRSAYVRISCYKSIFFCFSHPMYSSNVGQHQNIKLLHQRCSFL